MLDERTGVGRLGARSASAATSSETGGVSRGQQSREPARGRRRVSTETLASAKRSVRADRPGCRSPGTSTPSANRSSRSLVARLGRARSRRHAGLTMSGRRATAFLGADDLTASLRGHSFRGPALSCRWSCTSTIDPRRRSHRMPRARRHGRLRAVRVRRPGGDRPDAPRPASLAEHALLPGVVVFDGAETSWSCASRRRS